ncbi:MAG: T9SS C-terminal target domain-containing protein [Candidatus Kapaibacterium sp.]|nr:MAG: T9SS C-terminal target domain-containing protein [Candidatus Kapabacteria bacterium]
MATLGLSSVVFFPNYTLSGVTMNKILRGFCGCIAVSNSTKNVGMVLLMMTVLSVMSVPAVRVYGQPLPPTQGSGYRGESPIIFSDAVWRGKDKNTTHTNAAPTLNFPPNNGTNISILPFFFANPVSGAASYDFQVSARSDFADTPVEMYNYYGNGNGRADGLVWNIPNARTPLSNNTRYYWRVRAFGSTEWSAVWSFTTAAAGTAPAIPTLTSPSNGATNVPLQPDFTWTGINATGFIYHIEYSPDPTFTLGFGNVGNDQRWSSSGSSALQYNPSQLSDTLLPGTRYYWRVRTVSESGRSSFSPVFSFVTQGQALSFTQVSLQSIANASMSNLTSALSGNITLGEIPFSFPSGATKIFETQDFTQPTLSAAATIGTSINNPQNVYLLLDGKYIYKSSQGQALGSVVLSFANGASQTLTVRAGDHLRENWAYVLPLDNEQWNVISDFPSGGMSANGRTENQVRLNKPVWGFLTILKIPVQANLRNQQLTRIALTDTSPQSGMLLSGVTVEAAPSTTPANRSPRLISSLPSSIVQIGQTLQFTLSNNFTDDDGDALTYTVSSNNPNVVSGSVSNGRLNIQGVSPGIGTISITANDGRGGMVSTSFSVTVTAAPSSRTFDGGITISPFPFSQNDSILISVDATQTYPRSPSAASLAGSTQLWIHGGVNTGAVGNSATRWQKIIGEWRIYPSRCQFTRRTDNTNIFDLRLRPSNFWQLQSSETISELCFVLNNGANGSGEGGASPIQGAADPLKGDIFIPVTNASANRPPRISTSISNLTIQTGRNLQISVPGIFTDDDRDTLTYSASSSVSNIVTVVSISNSGLLTIQGVNTGTSTISITANDGRGGMVTTTFLVTVEALSCAGTTTLTSASGTFSDRTNALATYTNNLDCRWVIQPSSATGSITATFSRFSTEQCCDFVEIYAGTTVTGQPAYRFSGTNIPPPVSINASAMTIRFVTDGSVFSSGWSLDYSSSSSIGNRTPRTLFAPATQNIQHGQTGQLTLSTYFIDDDGDALTYTATSNSPSIASVGINNGILTIQGQSAGTTSIRVTASDGRGGSVSLSFSVNVNVNVSTNSASCSSPSVFTAASGSFSDRSNGTLPYANNLDCRWLIQPTPAATSITLAFSRLNTETCCDYVEIFSGTTVSATPLYRFSGTTIPNTVTVNAASVVVRFVTDGSVNGDGWTINYTSSSSNTGSGVSVQLPATTDVRPRNTFTIPISVGNTSGQNIISYQCVIAYNGSIFNLTGGSATGTLSDGMSVTYNTSVAGQMTIVAFGSRALSGSGTLLNLTGQLTATSGEGAVTIRSMQFNEGTPTASIVSTGSRVRVISEILCGDVSQNGTISALDAALIARHVDGSAVLTGVPLRAADVSGNREVTAFDAALIAQFADGSRTSFPNGCPPISAYVGQVLTGNSVAGTPSAKAQAGSSTHSTPIPVSLSRMNGRNGSKIQIPMSVGSMTGENILAYSFRLSYDPSILRISGALSEQTLSAGGTVSVNTATSGEVRVVYFTSRALTGQGTLINLDAEVIGTGMSELKFSQFSFNEGMPLATTTNGSLISSMTSVGMNIGSEMELLIHPNPANESASIEFTVPPQAQTMRVTVYNALGAEVVRLFDGSVLAQGRQRLQWQTQNIASGVYTVRVQSNSGTQTQWLNIVR